MTMSLMGAVVVLMGSVVVLMGSVVVLMGSVVAFRNPELGRLGSNRVKNHEKYCANSC